MKSLTKAGVVLGLGLGGFVDGILLHQILGWHHMICTTETCQVASVAALRIQNQQDAYFLVAAWILTAGGVGMLFRAARDPAQIWAGKSLFGAMLCGWGLFDLVEGIVDHQILGIHHVRQGHPHQFLFDLMFLGYGAALIVVGTTMTKSAQRHQSAAQHSNVTLAP